MAIDVGSAHGGEADLAEFTGPEYAVFEGGGLGVGQGRDGEIEGGAFAGEWRNEAAHLDGGDLAGGEDFFRVDVLGALGEGLGADAIEIVDEFFADGGGHVGGTSVGEFGDYGETFDLHGGGIGEEGVLTDGSAEGGMHVEGGTVAGVDGGATAALCVVGATEQDGGRESGHEQGSEESLGGFALHFVSPPRVGNLLTPGQDCTKGEERSQWSVVSGQ